MTGSLRTTQAERNEERFSRACMGVEAGVLGERGCERKGEITRHKSMPSDRREESGRARLLYFWVFRRALSHALTSLSSLGGMSGVHY